MTHFRPLHFRLIRRLKLQLTAVTEQRIEPWTTYSPNLYAGLSTLALHVVSGSGTQDLRSVSAYVTEAKRVRLLPTSAELLWQ
jgi:hypothetical protein